jgi:hypothetical protein
LFFKVIFYCPHIAKSYYDKHFEFIPFLLLIKEVEKHGAKVTSLKIPATVIVNKLKKYVDSAVEKMVYKNADCFQEELFPSTSAAESAAEEEQMVEIDISSVEQEDAFWTLLTRLGIEVSDFSNGDDDDREEFEDVERYMETCMPSSNNVTRPATGEGYSLNMKLRSFRVLCIYCNS